MPRRAAVRSRMTISRSRKVPHPSARSGQAFSRKTREMGEPGMGRNLVAVSDVDRDQFQAMQQGTGVGDEFYVSTAGAG